MNTDIKYFLSQLGLSEKEVELYICSLKSGMQTASTLAKKTGIARSTVNFIFTQLIQKGFAKKENRENTSYFSVIQPESLEYILLQKKAQANKQLSEFQNILPVLSALQNENALLPKVTYYEGLDSLCRVIDNCCTVDETVYFITSHNNMHPAIREYIENIYIPQSRKHKNKNKMIVSEGSQIKKYLDKAKGVYDEVILVDPKDNPFSIMVAIHGNSVDFISYDENDMSGVSIQNQLIADHMKTVFDLLKAHFDRA
ncbi:hypothetical protein HOD30_00710 [Candidatus Peregrinibacteria bacterium]|jgi:sugar-specific transcriptional regulator TrmB|nr:hypothetical protein [Candidatus Peregrinibacteria bacterium]MBT4631939.1 hypothetical protein [Candidatus Peregrinibacteria bacterium]MBT5516449.1 hypothetical protein [Candidatus Peregrinibacteria bacterium]MBT5823674.1 hypothetical protein [Candidatus Peregrinibacteria bacterium]